MPIYGYTCTNCEHTLDALQKMSDDPLVECPDCGKSALKRQLSAPRFRLKGQGWYETDFKKDNQRNLHGEKDSGAKTESGTKSEGPSKSESPSKAESGTKSASGENKADAKTSKKKSDKTSSNGKPSGSNASVG